MKFYNFFMNILPNFLLHLFLVTQKYFHAFVYGVCLQYFLNQIYCLFIACVYKGS